MHGLGVAMCVVGSVAALTTESLALWRSMRHNGNLYDFYRPGTPGHRWFFSGLALLIAGLVVLYH
jgi:hypothetical protein